jgi:hypothetical protein
MVGRLYTKRSALAKLVSSSKLYTLVIVCKIICLIFCRLLVSKGADLTAKTTGGGTAMWWAKRLDSSPYLIKYLESVNAPEEGEDL